MILSREFGIFLRESRLRINATEQDVSWATGLEVHQIEAIEEGKRPFPGPALDHWARALDMDPDLVMVELVNMEIDKLYKSVGRTPFYRIVPTSTKKETQHEQATVPHQSNRQPIA